MASNFRLALLPLFAWLTGCSMLTEHGDNDTQFLDDSPCQFHSIPGETVLFRTREAQFWNDGYPAWHLDTDRASPTLDYRGYAGRRGKLQPSLIKEAGTGLGWAAVVLDNCNTVYTSTLALPQEVAMRDVKNKRSIYSVEDRLKASEFVGRDIYFNKNGNHTFPGLLRVEPAGPRQRIFTDVLHLERLHVEAVITKEVGYSLIQSGLLFRVKTDDGKLGYLPFDEKLFFNNDPRNIQWGDETYQAIGNQRVNLGFTKDQVLLSWGSPKKILQSYSNGQIEQWEYSGEREDSYLYFFNGVLLKAQTKSFF